jgi:hypothetical protein
VTDTLCDVGWFMTPTGYVGDDDVMEVTIKLETISDKIRF